MKNFKILVWALMFTTAGAHVYAAGEVAATRQVTEVPGVMTRSIRMTTQQAARQEAARQALIKGGDQLAEVGSPRSITESSPVQIPARMQVVARQKIEQNPLDGLVLDENEAKNTSKDLNKNDGEGGAFELRATADQDLVDAQVKQNVDEIVNSVSQEELATAENDPAKKEQIADKVVDKIADQAGLSPEQTAKIKTDARQDIKNVKIDEPGAFSKLVSKIWKRISNGYLTQSGLNADLLYHAEYSNSEGLQKAIDAGADLNAKDRYGYTALHRIAYSGNEKGINALKLAGADVNVVDRDGNTPLHYAVDKGGAASVKLLVDAGANLNVQKKGGYTPLHSAVAKGDPALVKLLVDAGADTKTQDKNGHTALDYAASKGDMNSIRALKDNGALDDKDSNGNTALNRAAARGDTKGIIALSNAGADLNIANNKGHTVLDHAASKGDMNSIRVLKDKGALDDKDSNGNTALNRAAARGDTKAIIALSNAGADLNTQDIKGDTALHNAARNGNAGAVKALVGAGAKLKVMNNLDETPSDLAEESENKNTIDIFV